MEYQARRLRRRAVHPHGRGDNRHCCSTRIAQTGSPPRAWGQFVKELYHPPVNRFTPTGVGTIVESRARRAFETVHPHGRGDNDALRALSLEEYGSPPRAWGQCHVHRCAARRARFTPTGVGTIGLGQSWRFVMAVHPHGRGDNFHHKRIDERQIGSPPRAWGQSLAAHGCAGC